MTQEAMTVMEQDGIKVDLDTRMQFPTSIPIGLKIKLEQFAKEHKTSVGEVARSAIASAVGYTGSLGGKVVRKGMSEDEKKAHQAARQRSRNALINSLLEQYGVGPENEDDEDEDDDD